MAQPTRISIQGSGTNKGVYTFDATDINIQTDSALSAPHVSKKLLYETVWGTYIHQFPVPEKTKRRRAKKLEQARRLYEAKNV